MRKQYTRPAVEAISTDTEQQLLTLSNIQVFGEVYNEVEITDLARESCFVEFK